MENQNDIYELFELAGCSDDYNPELNQSLLDERKFNDLKVGTPDKKRYKYNDAVNKITKDTYFVKDKNNDKEQRNNLQSHYITDLVYTEDKGYNKGQEYEIRLLLGVDNRTIRNILSSQHIKGKLEGFGLLHFFEYFKDFENFVKKLSPEKYKEYISDLKIASETTEVDIVLSNLKKAVKQGNRYHSITGYEAKVVIVYEGIVYVLVLFNGNRNEFSFLLSCYVLGDAMTNPKNIYYDLWQSVIKKDENFNKAIENGSFVCKEDMLKFDINNNDELKSKYISNPTAEITPNSHNKTIKLHKAGELNPYNVPESLLKDKLLHWSDSNTQVYSEYDGETYILKPENRTNIINLLQKGYYLDSL